jgi:hypothetical protein
MSPYLLDPSNTSSPLQAESPEAPVVVGDVVVRRVDTGFGIFNYRGERVLDLPMRTVREAERLAAEIVSPWHGRVRVDPEAR